MKQYARCTKWLQPTPSLMFLTQFQRTACTDFRTIKPCWGQKKGWVSPGKRHTGLGVQSTPAPFSSSKVQPTAACKEFLPSEASATCMIQPTAQTATTSLQPVAEHYFSNKPSPPPTAGVVVLPTWPSLSPREYGPQSPSVHGKKRWRHIGALSAASTKLLPVPQTDDFSFSSSCTPLQPMVGKGRKLNRSAPFPQRVKPTAQFNPQPAVPPLATRKGSGSS